MTKSYLRNNYIQVKIMTLMMLRFHVFQMKFVIFNEPFHPFKEVQLKYISFKCNIE